MMRKTRVENKLAKLTIEELKGVANLWNLDVDAQIAEKAGKKKPSKKDCIISSIAGSICDKGRIRKVVNTLSDREKHILGIFALNNWSLESIDLYTYGISETELGRYPHDISSYHYIYYHAKEENKAKGLLGLLLLVTSRKYSTYGPVSYVVPVEFRKAINAEFTLEENLSIGITEQKAIKDRKYEGYAFLEDIFQFIAYAADGIVLTPSQHEIPKRTADKITNMLSVPTRDRLQSLLGVCLALKLVREVFQAGKPTLVATDRAEEFLKQSRDARAMILLAGAARIYDRLDKLIIAELKELEAGVWYDLTLFRKKIGNSLFQKRHGYWFSVYHRSTDKVFSHMRELGLLESGIISDNKEDHDAFLLTLSFFGSRAEATENVKAIIVQPTFEIVALPETPEDVLFNLSRFSAMKTADKVHIFALTKKTFLNAIDKGMNTNKIIELLQNNAKTEIPQNVLYSIEEWSKLYGKVGLKSGVFLDADPELMHVIKAKMKEHLIKEVSDSSVIINKDGVLSSLIKEEKGVFLEASDEITAAEVEKVIKKYVLRKPSKEVFVIEAENIEKCRTALKKKGIFPKDFISDKEEEIGVEMVASNQLPPPIVSSQQQKRVLIEEAIEEDEMIRMVYIAEGFKEAERVIEPFNVNDRYVEGYCHVKNERRMFRLDRIKRMEILEEDNSYGDVNSKLDFDAMPELLSNMDIL